MKFLRQALEKNDRFLTVKTAFLKKRSLPFYLFSASFVLGVTLHIGMTILLGLSLAILLGAWAPARQFVYKKVGTKPTPYSDLMIWTLLASVLLGVWRIVFFDPTRSLALYIGLLILMCFGLAEQQDLIESDPMETSVCKNVGLGMQLGTFLVGVSLFRVVVGYFFGIFSVLGGVFLALGIWVWYQQYKAGVVS